LAHAGIVHFSSDSRFGHVQCFKKYYLKLALHSTNNIRDVLLLGFTASSADDTPRFSAYQLYSGRVILIAGLGFGLLAVSIAFVSSTLGDIVQVNITLSNTFAAPLMTMFLVSMAFPFMNRTASINCDTYQHLLFFSKSLLRLSFILLLFSLTVDFFVRILPTIGSHQRSLCFVCCCMLDRVRRLRYRRARRASIAVSDD
jgi:hypothetical protein